MHPGDLGPALERLPGVLAATVFSDTGVEPRVYLAVGPEGDRDALRSAVLAILEDRGLPADPARIHIGTPPRHKLAAAPLPPMALDALDVQRSEGRATCRVQLRLPERSLSGSAREPDTASGRCRAAARALLSAVESVDPDLRLGLHGARTMDLFGHETVVVMVEAAAGRAHAHLPGSARVDRSVEEAAAMATLMALRSWTP